MRVVTEQEKKTRKAFRATGIPIMTERIFCFICSQNWESSSERPEACRICQQRYTDYGQFCKPDILLRYTPQPYSNPSNYFYGVVRVDDENLHKKNKKHRMHDYNQTELLEERGVKVFILYNEEVDDYYPWKLYAIARFFWECLTNDTLYKLYRADKDIMQRFSK